MAAIIPFRKTFRAGRSSVRQFLVAHDEDVADIIFDEFERITDITMVSGRSWYRFRPDRNTGFFRQDHTRQGGKMVVTQTLSFEYGMMEPNARQALRVLMSYSHLHVLIQDAQNRWHYAGISHVAKNLFGEYVGERMKGGNGFSTTGANPQSDSNGYGRTLVCNAMSDAPFLVPDFDFSSISIEEPDDRRITGDAFPPVHIRLDPYAGSIIVQPDFYANFRITFDERVLPATGLIRLYRFSDDALIHTWDIGDGPSNTNFTSSPTTFIITLYSSQVPQLDYSTSYYIIADAGTFVDVDGNEWAGITTKPADATGEWAFTTTPALDTIPPSIITLSPPDGGTLALTDGQGLITITLNEAVQQGAGLIRIYDVTGGGSTLVHTLDALIDPRFSISGSVATLDVSTLFEGGRTYDVVIDASAIQDTDFNDFIGLASGDWTITTTGSAFSTEFSTAFDA